MNKLNKQGDLIKASGPLRWTNRYDCPPGYSYNEEGWVKTPTDFAKLSVKIFPFMLNVYTVEELIFYNLLVLHALNPDKHIDTLSTAIRGRIKQAFGPIVELSEDILRRAINRFNTVLDEGNPFEYLTTDFLTAENIWYSKGAVVNNISSIKYLIKEDAITKMRDIMAIRRKYKTNEVMKDTEYSRYTINKYWKRMNLSATDRSINAVSEAMLELAESGIGIPTTAQLAEISGVSFPTALKAKKELGETKV